MGPCPAMEGWYGLVAAVLVLYGQDQYQISKVHPLSTSLDFWFGKGLRAVK